MAICKTVEPALLDYPERGILSCNGMGKNLVLAIDETSTLRQA